MNLKEIAKLIGLILICQLAGIIGSIFTFDAIPNWYASLTKPWFNPPSFIFAPVWILLYTLMGISLYLIIKKGFNRKEVKIATMFFGAQLSLNAIWSIIFFGLHNIFLALVEIIILWVVLLFTIIKFYKISKNAAYLLIPYFLWGSFATLLTLSIWILNP
ncbi:MAG: TspO/MBR family protein [Candidatus Diapherotrites archaeon]